jgi:L-Ala-D/L-Glu epimerase
MMRKLRLRHESWPIAGRFTISRGSKTVAEVILAEIEQGDALGRGECVPYGRYGESIASVMAQLEGLRGAVERGLDRAGLDAALPPGAARNALDCALWDLEAKRTRRPVWELAGLAAPGPVTTAYTLSLDTAERMGAAAKAQAARPLLKLKLAGPEDLDRVRAVRENAPGARLIVDANEGWTAADYTALAPELAALGVALIEQPLPAGADQPLAGLARPVPVCADESCHDRASLAHTYGRYDAVNIKLDKTGGLTEALALRSAARAAGYRIMIGCMLGTSLAMAPALLLAQGAEVVDLDGPLLLAKDRHPGLAYEGSRVAPAPPALWG